VIDRTANKRIQRFKDRTGLSFDKLGLMFGVSGNEVAHWYSERRHMPVDCQRTLFRFEIEKIDAVAKVRPETVRAFQEGRKRAKA
jgi:DNA-binding transcriptional regulator YiaG